MFLRYRYTLSKTITSRIFQKLSIFIVRLKTNKRLRYPSVKDISVKLNSENNVEIYKV